MMFDFLNPYVKSRWKERAKQFDAALAAGSRRAKTAKPVECGASQSGPKGNAPEQSA